MKITIATVTMLALVLITNAQEPNQKDLSEKNLGAVSDKLRKEFKLANFYQKSLVLDGFPIVSSAKVRDEALYESAWIIRSMLKNRPDILKALGKNKVRLAIMAWDERTADVPEHSDLKPHAFWNRRARGLGPTPHRPCVSCGEENLLNFMGDPYDAENILVHEFAHAIHDMGLKTVDPTFDQRLKQTYEAAKKKGLWKGKYAMQNHHEYWAEATQSWFWNNRENDHDHNHVNTREELVAYDPAVAKLCAEVYGENTWRYRRSDDSKRPYREHLKNLDRKKLPTFSWNKKEQEAYDAHQRKL
ncbi:MAG: hypothetical protein AB8F34_03360 [Akkermansiaceae bacterium]